MKNRIISGGAVIIFGLLIALGPQFLFKVCPVAGDMFMKCHWSAQAEIGAGALIAALGMGLIIFADPKIRLGLTLGIFLSGVLALLIPHALIGGCAMHSMPCRKIAFPAITVTGILLLVTMALNAAYLARLAARVYSSSTGPVKNCKS
ncbi:MAG: DUF4418 family protein [Spirochaetaceae bacterium]|jgi:hypothetical protein|nr:DUF4418 family protein [Spirochaetaceae bacterium]